MLRPPHIRYHRIYTYHLDRAGLPAFDDPDLIGVWEEDGTAILFFHASRAELVQELCRASGARLVYQADVDYDDWEAGRQLIPFTAGGLAIAPLWEEGPADIRLDPSVIFGTGFHPSTRLCLEALGRRLHHGGAGSLLDLGCGTGLLAIAAAKLGVKRILAVDHNSLACQVAARNAAENGCAERVRVRQLDLRRELPEEDADVLVANLHHTLLLELFVRPGFWRAETYILSGFLPSAEEALLAALPERELRFVERGREEKWCLWMLERRAGAERE